MLGHMRAWKWLVIFPLLVHTPPPTSGMLGHMPSLDPPPHTHTQGLYWRGAVSVPQFAFVSTVVGLRATPKCLPRYAAVDGSDMMVVLSGLRGEEEEPLSVLPRPLSVLISPQPKPAVLRQKLGPRSSEPLVPTHGCHAFSEAPLYLPQLCLAMVSTLGGLSQAARSSLPCRPPLIELCLMPHNPRIAGQVCSNRTVTLASLASSEPRSGFWDARGSYTQLSTGWRS